MTDKRYKELMIQVGMLNSRSLLTALQQAVNETEQSKNAEIEKLKKHKVILYNIKAKQQKEIKKLKEALEEVLPSLDTCYKDIPFPEDEKECTFFVAGLTEMYKYIKDGK